MVEGKQRCPLCNHVLNKRFEGLVCKNWKCKLYFKLERGWVCLTREKKDSEQFFKDTYQFDIEEFNNRKKWLRLKDQIHYEKKGKCEICGSKVNLQVHHILPRSECPCLTFDKENLMLLCGDCHKKIHQEDKYKFG